MWAPDGDSLRRPHKHTSKEGVRWSLDAPYARGWQWATVHRVARTAEGATLCARGRRRATPPMRGWRKVLHRARKDGRGRYTPCAAPCRDYRGQYTIRARSTEGGAARTREDGGGCYTTCMRTAGGAIPCAPGRRALHRMREEDRGHYNLCARTTEGCATSFARG